MSRPFPFYFVLFFTQAGLAQTGPYAFHLALMLDGGQKQVAPHITLLLNRSSYASNQDGVLFFTPAAGAKYLEIRVPNELEYVRVSDPIVPLPADPGAAVTIIIRKPTQPEQALRSFSQGLRRLNIRLDQIDSIQKDSQTGLSHALDSIIRYVTSTFQVRQADLRSATEKMRGRDQYYPAISSVLEGYLNEARDVRDVFQNLLAFALENPASFRLFDSTVIAYNAVYNRFNDHNDEYQKAVADYWDSEELAEAFHNLFDFAINDVHREKIIPLNALLNVKVNEYLHERNRGRRKLLRKDISATLQNILPLLNNDLPILETKIRYFLGKLDVPAYLFIH